MRHSDETEKKKQDLHVVHRRGMNNRLVFFFLIVIDNLTCRVCCVSIVVTLKSPMLLLYCLYAFSECFYKQHVEHFNNLKIRS